MNRPPKTLGRTRPAGFTLLELLVVILIIGLLTGIVGPRFLSQIGKSETTTARAQISSFDKALESFRIDMGRYPTESEGLKVLVTSPGSDARWRGPYLKDDIPNDPWGTPYVYHCPSSRGKDFDLVSLGRDRAPGGTGEDADITN
jgi:general secretion pathway protein G